MAEFPFKIGDVIRHPATGITGTVHSFTQSGGRSIVLLVQASGLISKYWTNECELVSNKPQNSWITW